MKRINLVLAERENENNSASVVILGCWNDVTVQETGSWYLGNLGPWKLLGFQDVP